MAEEIKKEENRKLTEDELKRWNELYEEYKTKIPKGVYQHVQQYCVSTAILMTKDLSIEDEKNIINKAQKSINFMQEFLDALSDLLNELREKDDKEDTEVKDNE